MNCIVRRVLVTVISGFIVACDKNETSDKNHLPVSDFSADRSDEPYHDPYMEFCLQGFRQDIDPNTLSDDDCIFRTEGRNRADLTDPKANAFFARVSGFPALQKAGIDDFGINIKIGPQAPKIEQGVYTVTPYSILSREEKSLPDIMVSLSAIENHSIFSALMKPDIDKWKQSEFTSRGFIKPEDIPPYEIVSATLTVAHIEDIPLDEDEKIQQKLQAEMGMLTGKQYIKGTFTFTVKKFGDSGSNFGPETFTFGSINEWAYFPEFSK